MWLLLLFLSLGAAAEPLTLESAVAEALSRNPKLKALRAEALARRHRPPQAGALPDPRLSFRAMSLPAESFDPGIEPMSQLQVELSQTFPFPGKLSLRERAALLEAAAAEARYREARLWTIAEVWRLWWRLFELDRSLEKLKEAEQLMEQSLKVAEVRYRVGKGLQQDVLLAQLELSRLFDRELELKRRREELTAQLNALLDRPASRPIFLPQKVEASWPKGIDPKALRGEALRRRPLLQLARLELERSERLLELARRELFPDLTVTAAYGVRTQFRDFVTFGISVPLPLDASQKQLQAIRERAREREGRQEELQAALRKVEAEIETASSDFQRARERLELLRKSILPQARQTVASMLAAYQVGKVDFLNLVRAELILLEQEIEAYRRLAELQEALARLAAATGLEEIGQ